MSVAIRVIPCLDVTAGRVVKGTVTAIENTALLRRRCMRVAYRRHPTRRP